MVTITTATGKQFDSDMVAENPSPPRLYINIVNSTLAEVAVTFTDPAELPLKGYSTYKVFQSITDTPAGVSVSLKKKGT